MDISYTKYRFYRECPWKYKLAFVDQRQVALNAKSSYGLSMHRALEHWLQGADGAYEFIDYKTGPGVPTVEQVMNDRQMRFYALGAQRGLELPRPETLTVDCVTVGERVSAPYDGAGEDALDADIRAAASGIEAEDFKTDCPYSVVK